MCMLNMLNADNGLNYIRLDDEIISISSLYQMINADIRRYLQISGYYPDIIQINLYPDKQIQNPNYLTDICKLQITDPDSGKGL